MFVIENAGGTLLSTVAFECFMILMSFLKYSPYETFFGYAVINN